MKLIFTLFCSSLFLYVSSQHFKPREEGSEIGFTIRNFGVGVSGTFTGIEGDIIFDENDLPVAAFNVTVKANTVNTGIRRRDNHLNQEEYLDTEKYPVLQFVSNKITTSTEKGYWFVFGKLTIKGVTKEISFPFKATKDGEGYIFEGSFIINRRDFNVGGSSLTMADELTVDLRVSARTK